MNVPQPKYSTSAAEDAATRAFATLRGLFKHWPIVLACVVLSTAASLVVTRSTPPVYQSVAMLEFDPHPIRPLANRGDTPSEEWASFMDNHEYYETQYKIITSERVMTGAARNLGLQNDYEFFGAKKALATPPTAEEAGAVLRGHILVEPIRNSRLVTVRVEDTDSKRARRICEAVISVYISQNLEQSINATSDAVAWLNGQVDTVQHELEDSENALHTFKQHNDLPSTSINEASNMLRLELQDLNDALTKTRTKKQELLARHAELAKVASDSPDLLPASELLGSAFLQTLRTQYEEANRERGALIAEGKGENHPLVKKATDRVAEARAALLGEVRNIQGAVERDLAVIEREEAGKAGLFEEARKRAVDLNMKEIEYHRLDRARDNNEKLFALLLERTKEADLARMMRVNNIRVVDNPTNPGGPVRPRPSTNIAMGIIAGLLLGIVGAWLRERLDVSLKTPEDIEQQLGITFLGLIPSIDEEGETRRDKRLRSRRRKLAASTARPELIVHERPLSGVAEAARSVRTNLMFMNPDRPYRKILVTSSAPAEGKTTVACAIAIALAQSGQRVCIVDCDLRRPRLHRLFDRAGDAGVTNVLVGDASIEQVAKPTMVGNLWCIPAGPIPPNPADVLHSERFKKFLSELGERFDRVILDSPPLVAVTDSAIVSTLVDGTVFVLRAFATSRALGRQGLRTLADVDGPVIGCVLNAVDFNKHEYSYYQYYYRRDGYGPLPSHDDPQPPDATASPPPN